ncbi:alpha/beta-hydrolase [Myriangium duriaei CBS 260.36]|uniref:Carboxylic ester hydrolase n=1 Tax=Myriangium duriaei CBS 260.36 TaxID=1168546 RepID=A0A9P4MPE3_9PEZI|nr:alpha/beta-hydrolase [Myriangium duriaei CBS 260.36]
MKGAFFVSAFATLLSPLAAVDPLVDLSYSRYQGTPLANGITQWLGIRYAAPPLGNLRFAAPQNPLPDGQTHDASTHGPYCLGVGKNLPVEESDEDCLFLDVYAPSGATTTSKHPVMVFIQGGGFSINSNPNYNGSGLIQAGDMDMVVVVFNYRVGPFGFLSGTEIARGGSSNNGIKDQRQVFKWIQQNISLFGGNPGRVVLMGASAGGASIGIHLATLNGRNYGLFHGTAATAQTFATMRTVLESQYQYDGLVQRTGCTSSQDTLACLRSLNSSYLQSHNINIAGPGATAPPLYMYAPTFDKNYLTDYTLKAFSRADIILLPSIWGDSTNEGTIFAPKKTNSLADSDTFLKNQYPTITNTELNTINSLYPVAEQFPNAGSYWRQLANAYGEVRYICPGIYIPTKLLNLYSGWVKPAVWNYHWNVIDPTDAASGKGVRHTVELTAIFGPEYVTDAVPASYRPGGVNAPLVPVIQKYWTNFVRALDPNAYPIPALNGVPSPAWGNWPSNGGNSRLLFETGGVAMEKVPADQQSRCNTVLQYMDDLRQ